MNLNQTGQLRQYPEASPTVQAPNTGLHDGLAGVASRINHVNATLDGVLQRIHGPRPTSAPQGKSAEMPSILNLAAAISSELDLLEKLTHEICEFIG